MTNEILKSKRWVKENPITMIVLLVLSIAIGAVMAFEDFSLTSIILCGSFLIYAWWLVHSDMKRWSSIVIAFLIAVPPTRTEPAPIVVGCLIVAVGVGIVGCKLNSLCKKKFGTPSTNAPPNELYAASGGDTEAAVICVHHKKNCEDGFRAAAGEQPKTSFTISGRLVLTEAQAEIQSLSISITPPEELLDFAEYEQRMIALGLTPCTTSGCSSYSRNGIPILKEESRITLGQSDGAPSFEIASDLPSFRIAIERSYDLQTWTAISYGNIPVGNVITFGDDPDSTSAFYRMRILP